MVRTPWTKGIARCSAKKTEISGDSQPPNSGCTAGCTSDPNPLVARRRSRPLIGKGQSGSYEWDFDGGLGNDEVAFDWANFAGPIRVDRSEAVNLRNSAPGSLVTSLASITVWQHSHTTAETSKLNVGAGTTIRGDAVVESEVGYVNVTGRIAGALPVNTPVPPTAGWTTNNLSYVTLFAGGEAGGNLSVGRSDLLASEATVSVEGRVNGNLLVYGSSVSDVVLANTVAVTSKP